MHNRICHPLESFTHSLLIKHKTKITNNICNPYAPCPPASSIKEHKESPWSRQVEGHLKGALHHWARRLSSHGAKCSSKPDEGFNAEPAPLALPCQPNVTSSKYQCKRNFTLDWMAHAHAHTIPLSSPSLSPGCIHTNKREKKTRLYHKFTYH